MASDRKEKSGLMRDVFRTLVCITQFGINMLVPVTLCFLAGLWLDERLGTSFIAILLFFVGALAGGRNVYRLFKKHMGIGKDDRPC